MVVVVVVVGEILRHCVLGGAEGTAEIAVVVPWSVPCMQYEELSMVQTEYHLDSIFDSIVMAYNV